jgi:putative ABC transport system permease protein
MSVGSDFILQMPGASAFFALSEAGLNERIANVVLEVPGVADVTSIYSKFSSRYFGLIFGIDWESFDRFPGRLQIMEGTPSLQGNEVIIDQFFASSQGLSVGDTMDILGHDYTVTAICRPGAIVRVFVPLKTFQEQNAAPERVTAMFIKAEAGADIEEVHAALSEQFEGYSLVRSDDPNLLLAETRMPGLSEFRMLIVLVSMLLAFMIVLLAMYTTIFERTREIGILKSLGASWQFIVGMILKESVIICCLGVILGVVASEAIRLIITVNFPTIQVSITLTDMGKGLALGVLAGVLGALYPAYKAARMDPVKALSYE